MSVCLGCGITIIIIIILLFLCLLIYSISHISHSVVLVFVFIVWLFSKPIRYIVRKIAFWFWNDLFWMFCFRFSFVIQMKFVSNMSWKVKSHLIWQRKYKLNWWLNLVAKTYTMVVLQLLHETEVIPGSKLIFWILTKGCVKY